MAGEQKMPLSLPARVITNKLRGRAEMICTSLLDPIDVCLSSTGKGFSCLPTKSLHKALPPLHVRTCTYIISLINSAGLFRTLN